MDDQDDGEKRERVLLRPWLENLIEGGSIPGLEWMDDSKSMFKVPWKHRSKKTWSLRHSSIFLEWAKNTGRWSEGDLEPNYAQLKTRLRCAFNKAPDIEEMREFHRTKAEEPYKVYKFIPRKESKLYPFGRKPLRKTTVPITVRRRRYFISRAASTFFGVSGGRRAVLSDSSSIRIKEEKENVANSSYKEMMAEENFNEPVINQNWKNWLPNQNEIPDGGQISSWPHVYEEKAKEQINRILPLIVEEANTNSMDVELPVSKNKEVEHKGSNSILPEIKDHTDSVHHSVGIPRVLEEFQMDKEEARNKEVFASASLSPEKLEYLHDWRQNSYAVYDLNAANRRPPAASSTDMIFSNGSQSILPQLNEKISHTDSTILCSSSGTPPCWPHPGLDVKLKMRSCSPGHFVQKRQSSHDSEIVGPRKSDLVPAARLLPLKKLYGASQNVFDADKSSMNCQSIIHKGHADAVEKPNVAAQPRVAVAAPYDGRSTQESGQQFTTELVLGDLNKDAVKHKVHLPELEVIDLSAKVSVNETQNSESRVLDLTKKMVVTPFERGCNVWKSATKSCSPDAEKDICENLVPSDSSSTIGEFMKFKSEYKRKKQLIVTKMMLLVEKEKELKAREKQLAAREEALFWKETYLHRVLSGLEYNSVVSTSRSGYTMPFAPSFEASNGLTKLIRSPELKEAHLKNCAPPALTLFTHQRSPVLMPGGGGAAAEIVHQPLDAVPPTRPEHLNLVPGFHVGSRDAKDGLPSSAATSATSSANPHCVPIGAAWPISYEDLKMTPRASMLLPGDRMKYDGGIGLHSELESDVALGSGDYPLKKSYPHAVKKSQQETAPLSLSSARGMPIQPLPTTRKRGRPKGSKNKVKPVSTVNATSPLTRQMPPLLVIHPSGMNDAIIPTPNAQRSVPFHYARNENLSEVIADHCEYKGNSAAMAYSDKSFQAAARGPRSYETDRILPPVTTAARVGSSPATLPVSEPTTPNHLPLNHAALFDNLPNKDAIPDTVRQLLVSASRPVSSILPPLSPAKSPGKSSSSPKAKVAFVYRHDEKFCEEEKVVTSVC